MNRREVLIGSTGMLVAAALGVPPARAGSNADFFSYRNPIFDVVARDCQIVRDNGIYYLIGTFPPFWGDTPSPGVRMISSADLVTWSAPQLLVRPDNWYRQLFWAPELFPYRGKYYLTFNCPAIGDAKIGPGIEMHQSAALAVADRITGDYRVLTTRQPLLEGNDASLFLDSDGKVYIYWNGVNGLTGIFCAEIDLENAVLIGRPKLCIDKGDSPGWEGGTNVGIEGPSVFKRGPLYYLLYASWGRGYEVGYATAAAPTGPWHKFPGNPIFGAQDPYFTERSGATYSQSPDVPFGQVSHGSPFFGPDGRIWFSCHGIAQKDKGLDLQPHLILTPMAFRDDGSIAMELTWTPQSVLINLPSTDPYWRPFGTPASETV